MSVEVNERAGAPRTDGKTPLIKLIGVKKYFPIKRGIVIQRTIGNVHAVDGVDLEVYPGETVGLVGETGCGKSTLARVIMKLYDPTDGQLFFDGQEYTDKSRGKMRPLRREMQMIFQDPYASLNSRKTVGSIIGEPFRIHKTVKGDKIRSEVQQLMELVGLNPEHYNRYPHEFSGGQRQRIGVARALALKPRLIIADEPVSALDVSIQAQILNLLEDLQEGVQPDLSVHRARPVGGEARVRPGRGHVPGQDRRDGARADAVPDAEAPLHRGAAVGGADPGPRPARPRGSGSSSRATCPRRSTRRRAAGSIRGARGPSSRSARRTSRP